MSNGAVTGKGSYKIIGNTIYLDGELDSVLYDGRPVPSRIYKDAYRVEGDLLVSINDNGPVWKRD